MKIRSRKDKYPEYEVLDESDRYYIVTSKISDVLPDAYPKALYEPVPTERWVDVTAECKVKQDDKHIVYHDGNVLPENGIRLRKIGHGTGNGHLTYFIVERKEPA